MKVKVRQQKRKRGSKKQTKNNSQKSLKLYVLQWNIKDARPTPESIGSTKFVFKLRLCTFYRF